MLKLLDHYAVFRKRKGSFLPPQLLIPILTLSSEDNLLVSLTAIHLVPLDVLTHFLSVK